jgi:tetratricopeptide (TPR) repeat protein
MVTRNEIELVQKIAGLIKQGDQFYLEKKYKEAIEFYSKSIKLGPNASAYRKRGQANRKLDQDNRAYSDFTNAIILSKGDVNSYLERAELLLKKDRIELAIKDYEQAFKLSTIQTNLAKNGVALATNLRELQQAKHLERERYKQATTPVEQEVQAKPAAINPKPAPPTTHNEDEMYSICPKCHQKSINFESSWTTSWGGPVCRTCSLEYTTPSHRYHREYAGNS